VTAWEAAACRSLAHSFAGAGRTGASLRVRTLLALDCRQALHWISKPTSRSTTLSPNDHCCSSLERMFGPAALPASGAVWIPPDSTSFMDPAGVELPALHRRSPREALPPQEPAV
jgi:hypothetical protein